MTDWEQEELMDGLSEYEGVISLTSRYVGEKLARIRLGVYSEKQDGSVQEVLEEIERILR